MIGEVEGNEVSSRYGVSVRQRVENSSASLLKQEVNMSNQSMQMYSTYIYIYTYIQILLGMLALILIAYSVYHTYIYICIYVHTVYSAYKKEGLPILYAAASILPFQALPILSMYVKMGVITLILLNSTLCASLFFGIPKTQTSTSPHVSKQLSPPPGIFGFLLFRTPGTQVINNSQGRGLRGRCWGGCRELYLDVPGRKWMDQWWGSRGYFTYLYINGVCWGYNL